MKTIYIIILLVCWPILVYNTQSQVIPEQSQVNEEPDINNGETEVHAVDPPKDDKNTRRPLTETEWVLSIGVLSFGLIIFLVEAILIKSNRLSAEVTVRLFVITLIIIGTLFLISAGYSSEQIGAATGLLGTIAGYILGRMNNTNAV